MTLCVRMVVASLAYYYVLVVDLLTRFLQTLLWNEIKELQLKKYCLSSYSVYCGKVSFSIRADELLL